MAIKIDNLSVSYRTKTVLSDINLSYSEPGVHGLIGPNGAGKSTCMRAVAGIHPYQGTVTYDGKSLADYPRPQRPQIISYIQQYSGPPIGMTAREVVMLARTAGRSPLSRPDPEDAEIVSQALNHTDSLGIAERPLSSLSGGQVQRVMLARAIAQRASHMLLDEPNNHLDLQHQYNLMELLQHFSSQHDLVVLIAIHDLGMAARFCDSLTLLGEGGILLAQGDPEDILTPETLREVFGVHAQVTTSESGRKLLDVSGTTLKTWGPHLSS